MNKWQLAILIITQLLLSVVVITKGCEGIHKGFPDWLAIIIISAWFVLCCETDRYIWQHDIHKSELITQQRDGKGRFAKGR